MKKSVLVLLAAFCTGCLWQQPVRNTDIPDTTGYPFPTRIGTACSTTWFGLWSTGDASPEEARKKGGITTISSVTKSENSFLGIVRRKITTVRGN